MRVRLGDYIKEYSVRNKAGEDIPVYSVTNTQGFCRDYFGKEVASKDKSTYKIVPKGYFAYNPSRINVGSVDWQRNEDRVIVSPLYNVFSVANELNQQYLYYYLKSDITLHRIKSIATGSVRDNLKFDMLSEFKINLPNVNKQISIVNILDKIGMLIRKQQTEIEKLDDLIKSRFVEMFGDPITNTKGWKIEKAEKHIDLLSGFPFDSSQYTQYGVKICGGLIIMPQRIDWNSCKYWSSTEDLEEYTLQEKDIVMALDRPWISEGFKIAMVDADELPALLIQRTARIRAVDINQYYLMHCFALGGFDIHCNVTGSLVPHISAKDIRSFPIMLPPIELQKKFAAFVEQIDKSKLLEWINLAKKSFDLLHERICIW